MARRPGMASGRAQAPDVQICFREPRATMSSKSGQCHDIQSNNTRLRSCESQHLHVVWLAANATTGSRRQLSRTEFTRSTQKWTALRARAVRRSNTAGWNDLDWQCTALEMHGEPRKVVENITATQIILTGTDSGNTISPPVLER